MRLHDFAALAAVAVLATGCGAPQTGGVPTSCLDALDRADQGFLIVSDFAGATQDLIDAIAAADSYAAMQANEDIRTSRVRLETDVLDQYLEAKDACREAAG